VSLKRTKKIANTGTWTNKICFRITAIAC